MLSLLFNKIIIVILVSFACLNESAFLNDWIKTRRKSDLEKSDFNSSSYNEGRGFFPGGGLFSIGKVLNFFPVGGERECKVEKGFVARSGICLNPYDCRQRDGRAAGDCAHGLGVCCVFEVTCGAVVQHNLTYFMSPGFPDFWMDNKDCEITIEKAHEGITQVRLDFVHFNIGQPNRTTGECDEDVMVLGRNGTSFNLCGQNHGQHLYHNMPTVSEAKESDDDLLGPTHSRLAIRPRGPLMPRLWLIRLVQLPLAYSAPHNCLQYFTQNSGMITTFNYAINGRHLAQQNYRACVRHNTGMCGVRYSPCEERSFRIGPGTNRSATLDASNILEEGGPGIGLGPGTGFYGPDGSFVPDNGPTATVIPLQQADNTELDQQVVETQNVHIGPVKRTQRHPGSSILNTTKQIDGLDKLGRTEKKRKKTKPSDLDQVMEEEFMPVNEAQVQNQQNEIEGSGMEPQILSDPAQPSKKRPQKSLFSWIWSFIWPWGSQSEDSRTWKRWSPYFQHYVKKEETDGFPYYGYGNFGAGLVGYGRQRCNDRITIPCDNEYFISKSAYGPGVCDPHHCGNNFCPGLRFQDCFVETSASPFAVSVNFGPPVFKSSAEDNIGACIKYSQMPCE